MYKSIRSSLTRLSLSSVRRGVHVEAAMKALGLSMPSPPPNRAFVQFVRVGNVCYLSGHLPQPAEGPLVVGKVGKEVDVELGYEAAKYCGLALCSTLAANIGDLDKVQRVVKLTGFVNCIDGFKEQPQVVNGCSELFIKLFGAEKGAHARSAVGTNSLPLGVPVEIEAIFELAPESGAGAAGGGKATA